MVMKTQAKYFLSEESDLLQDTIFKVVGWYLKYSAVNQEFGLLVTVIASIYFPFAMSNSGEFLSLASEISSFNQKKVHNIHNNE